MKLKTLLLTKFINKYTAIGTKCEGLEAFVQTELDSMFSGERFDERDLVKIDRRVRAFIKNTKLQKLMSAQSPSIKLPDAAKKESVLDGSRQSTEHLIDKVLSQTNRITPRSNS